MADTGSSDQPDPRIRLPERQSRIADASRFSVSVIEGVAALERLAPEINHLNLASSRPNPFLSAAFLRCYALQAEYHAPGKEECCFVIEDGTRLIGCAPMRRSVDDFGSSIGPLRLQGARLRLLAPLDTEQPGILSAPEDEDAVAAALIDYLCNHDKNWGMLEFVGQKPGNALHRAMHAASGSRFRARDIPVEPYNEIRSVWGRTTCSDADR